MVAGPTEGFVTTMKHLTSGPRLVHPTLVEILGVFLSVLCLTACDMFSVYKRPRPATTEPGGAISGTVTPWTEGTPIAGRHIALCRSLGDPRSGRCELLPQSAETNQLGHFIIDDIPPGTYFILYDSGLSYFDKSLARWGGEVLHFGDKVWLSEFLSVDLESQDPTFRIPDGIEVTPHENWLRPYCVLTLLVGDSPFIIAHDLDRVKQDGELSCKLVTVESSSLQTVEIQVIIF